MGAWWSFLSNLPMLCSVVVDQYMVWSIPFSHQTPSRLAGTISKRR
nr:MAG TPA: hypothetical protein [Caudoviricetes sp.]